MERLLETFVLSVQTFVPCNTGLCEKVGQLIHPDRLQLLLPSTTLHSCSQFIQASQPV
jgi:hypothetical protein